MPASLYSVLPVLRGVIDRRILLNYRVDPDVAARLLPDPFRPHLVVGQAVVGACLIRLVRLRPKGLPRWLGLRFDNAAIRVAAEWEAGAATHRGVFVLARYTASPLAVLAGGRVFPGVHRRARFDGDESAAAIRVAFHSSDGMSVSVAGAIGDSTDCPAAWPPDSVFSSAAEASAFFAAGNLGYSWNRRRGEFEGMELRVRNWQTTPLCVHHAASSFFDDPQRFPPGSIALDHALLMRNVEHEWHVEEPIAPLPPAIESVQTPANHREDMEGEDREAQRNCQR